MQQINLKTKIYIAVFITFFSACIASSIWSTYFRGSSTSSTTLPTKIVLNNFNHYTYTIDYTWVSNEATVEPQTDNFVYKPKIEITRNIIRQAASKLGLSNESHNAERKFTAWTKEGVNELFKDYITFDEFSYKLNLRFAEGLNKQPLEDREIYPFIAEFLGIPKHEVVIVENSKFDVYNTITYQVKLFGKIVNFDKADQYFATVGLANGKIVQLFTYVLPFEYEKDVELKPLTKISSQNLSSLYVQANFKSEVPTGASAYGSEFSFRSPARVGYRKHDFEYIYFKNSDEFLLIPVIKITGVYTDAAGQRGEAILIIVNQEP